MSIALHNPFHILMEDDLGFVYSGSFHDGLTARLIDLSETVLSRSSVSKSKRNKLAFAMVEAYQNIIRHKISSPVFADHPDSRPAFIVRSNREVQSLVAMNAVPNEIGNRMQKRIEHINSMSRDELKRLFLNGLEANSISDKGGAGLGLIEMARRSGNKLGVRLVSFTPEHAMFLIAVVIGNVDDSHISQVLDDAMEFHSLTVQEDLLILHKGELSATAVSALLPMVQRDMDSSPQLASVRSRAYLAGVEVFRSRDTIGDGIFTLSKQEEGYELSIGQALDKPDAALLENAVADIVAMSQEELNTHFRRSLLSQDRADKELRGLLDLALCSSEPIRATRNTQGNREFVSISASL